MKIKDRKVLAAERRFIQKRNKGFYVCIPQRFIRYLRLEPKDKLIWMLMPDGYTIRVKKATFNEGVMGDDHDQLTTYMNEGKDGDPTEFRLNNALLIEVLGDAPLTPEQILNLDFPDGYSMPQKDPDDISLLSVEKEDLGEDL